ncbi:MAG: diaminopimelate decarboxylase [Gemmatimonadota bacterium]|nr:diaminopimelate decarboxylase [Gemmatimonadota bacterium]
MIPAHAASVSSDTLRAIAAEVGTPVYVYDARAIDAGAARWTGCVADPARICFAAKANSNLAVLARLERHGIGLEVATPGELGRGLAAGFAAPRIVLGGVPKSDAAVEAGLRAGVGLLVLQSEREVEAALRLADGAAAGAVRADAAGADGADGPLQVGIRVRPGIRAGAHPSLETGREDAKFGFPPDGVEDAWRALAASRRIRPTTLAVHLGSGLPDAGPYERALDVILGLADRIGRDGPPVAEIDIGGGLGIAYDRADGDPEPADLVARVERRLAGSEMVARYEPGRSVVARAGVLLTRVLYRRERDGAPALVCDAGYTDFARYALYGGQHRVLPVGGREEGEPTVEVLGPTCESGDVLGTARRLHGVRADDLLAMRDAGAYGFVMASNYNSRPRPAEVLVDGDGWRVVRPRERLEDLWRHETVA